MQEENVGVQEAIVQEDYFHSSPLQNPLGSCPTNCFFMHFQLFFKAFLNF